jgi:hypothetical protein
METARLESWAVRVSRARPRSSPSASTTPESRMVSSTSKRSSGRDASMRATNAVWKRSSSSSRVVQGVRSEMETSRAPIW